MKLYYLQGACSLATYISLLEAGQKFEAISVERGTKKTADGKTLDEVNPKSYVPVLVLDDGTVMSENVAVLSYVATLNPGAKLAPPVGTVPYFKVVEWVAYVNSELHKGISPVFFPDTTPDAAAKAREKVQKRLEFVEKALAKGPFLTGSEFTVADAYLYVVMSWNGRTGVSLDQLPKTRAFVDQVAQRPSVKAARRGEGMSET